MRTRRGILTFALAAFAAVIILLRLLALPVSAPEPDPTPEATPLSAQPTLEPSPSTTAAVTSTPVVQPADRTEIIDGTPFRHYFVEAAGVRWHLVESGAGPEPPIVFIHGIPGAWVSWHRVMSLLSDDRRALAFDLKGMGESEQAEGSYNAEVVAGEMLAALDAHGIESFALVGHEWGSVVASYIAAQAPDRVTQFIRISAPLSDAALNQINTLKSVPQIGAVVLADGEGFVRRMYTGAVSSLLMNNVPGNVVAQPIPEADVERIALAFSREGTANTIIRYYSDSAADLRAEMARLAPRMTMPVLLLQGDSDPIQPVSEYADATDGFPDATLTILQDCGHVPMLEQPERVAEFIRAFVS